MEQVRLLKGDNMELLKTLETNSIDSVVSDPPYGLSFLNKKWDYDVPSVELWKEVLRVLKPGGHVLAFGGTRTYHHLVMNMELAGFEIRDTISYMYGSGFPKSHNIGKAIDKLNGNERTETDYIAPDGRKRWGGNSFSIGQEPDGRGINKKTKGNSDWEGWGTALKPSMELICLARKPLTEKSIAENVLKHGTGGINIDDCRVESETRTIPVHSEDVKDDKTLFGLHPTIQHERVETTEGRFPANTILECICDEPHNNPECPCYILDKQSGNVSQGHWAKTKTTGFGEFGNGSSTYEGVGRKDKIKGGASRFFYTAKVSKKERNIGLDEITNFHPTVKPINLMTYLCRLITPKDGVVLDMYMGSGSTGISALIEGFNFIGMEMDEDYFNIAEARINNYEQYRQFKK